MSSSKAVFGLVLCGGLSTRMGKDKALMDYHGLPQYEWASNLLKPFCEKVYCSVSKKLDAKINADKIVDKYDSQGPLGGLISAFCYNDSVSWIVISCDMPYLVNEDVEQLMQDAKVPLCYNIDGFINPLFSYWPSNCLSKVINYYEDEERSPKVVFKRLNGRNLKPLDPERHRNVNKL